MIENLNALTISAFGEILLDESRDGYERLSIHMHENPKEYSVWEHDSVLINKPKDMALLQVFNASIGRSTTFYLDKPVRLFPGIPFALTPLSPPLEAELYIKEGAVKSTLLMEVPGASVLRPSLSIPCLYTLFYQEKPKGFFFSGESHEPYELTYVDMGRLHCVVGGRDLALSQQELMLFAPRQWHMQYAQADMPVNFVTISFDVLPNDLPLPCGAVIPATRELTNCLQRILALQKEDAPYQGDMILSLCTQVLLLLLRGQAAQSEREEPAAAAENLLVERALLYIDAHFMHHLTVGEVASHIHVSPSYLATLFKRQLKVSPLHHIQRLRLNQSRQLLVKGEENIAQISARLGYKTPQHFSRAFKDEFGFSPREFARSLKVAAEPRSKQAASPKGKQPA